MKPQAHRQPEGFTLVEIVIVIVIVALVAAFAWPAYEGYVERSRVLETTARITDMQKTIRDYEISKGALPDGLGDVGLDVRRDGWGRPY